MSAATVFSPRVILGWIAAVAATFALSIYLIAFGSGDTQRNAFGPSVFSTSAIGYAGIQAKGQAFYHRVSRADQFGIKYAA